MKGLKFFSKEELEVACRDERDPNSSTAEDVLLALALCHSIVIDKRTGKMNSASPDELALVEGAKTLGFSFEGKDGAGVISIKRTRD